MSWKNEKKKKKKKKHKQNQQRQWPRNLQTSYDKLITKFCSLEMFYLPQNVFVSTRCCPSNGRLYEVVFWFINPAPC